MKKLSILAISSLLLVSTAFAAEQPKAEQQETVATVQVAGKTIATLKMVNVAWSVEMGPGKKVVAVYDPKKREMTYTGKFTIEARQGDKRLLQLAVDDGVVTIGPMAMPEIKEMPKSKAKT